MNGTDYGRSVIRTIVPLIVGSLVGWFVSKGVEVDRGALTAALDSLLGGLYYVVIRAVERRWPKAGWLLGAPGAPTYGVAGGGTGAVVAPVASPGATGGDPTRG